MNPMIVTADTQAGLPHSDLLESLVSEHFDRAYLVFNTFVDDPRQCLDLTEGLFRQIATAGQLSTQAIHASLVHRVRCLAHPQPLVDGLEQDEVLCWLLKETFELSYAQVAAAMDADRDTVKHAIAAVRAALLEQL